MRTGGSIFRVMSRNGDTSSDISAIAFGTIGKPTHNDKLRIVDVNTGKIYSQQDGRYFPTGQ